MVPTRNMDVKLTDRYIATNPSLAHLKDAKLMVMKVDLNFIAAGGVAEYIVSFTDGSYIHQLTIDQAGRINGIDVFESWVAKAGIAQGSFDFGSASQGQNDQAPAPRNNDGRATCFWCSAPTRKAGGGAYDVCSKCGR